jgi:hypothetical protein
MAKKNNVNITVGVDQENLKKDWNEAFKVTQSAAKSIEKEAAEMALKVTKAIDSMSPQRQLRALTTLSIKMNEVGMSGTKSFQQVAKAAAALKSNIGDTKAEIDALQPDAPFRAFANTAQGAANAFAGIQGAMALVGAESEDLQKTLVKVQGAMALAQGLESIGQLEDAFKQLNLVMKANPALLVGTAFVALAAAAVAIQDSFSDLTDAQRDLNEVHNKAIESYAEEEALLTALNTELNTGNKSRDEQKAILEQFIQKYPKLLGNLTAEQVLNRGINATIQQRIRLMELEAKAEASKKLYVQNYEKVLLAQQKIREEQGKGFSLWEDIKGIFEADEISKAWDAYTEGERATKSFLKIWRDLATEVENFKASIGDPFKVPVVPAVGGGTSSGGTTALNPTKSGGTGYDALLTAMSRGNKEGLRGMVPKPEEFKLAASGFNALTLSVNSYNNAINKVIVSAEQLSMLLRDSVNSAIIGTAEAFGQALASGQDFGAAVGKSLLLAMANFMRQLGEMFIKAGTAKLAFDNAITIPGGAGIAIAAGFALAAGAAAMTSKLQQQNKPTAFADGGIVYGPTLGLMGEYAGASSNPEVIAPLDKLKSLIGGTGENSMVASTKIDGRDLYLIVQRAGKDMGRG